MSYVRVDQEDKYIYFLNDIPIYYSYYGKELVDYRSNYLIQKKGRFPCIRMKRLPKLPLDKKVNVWYNKSKR